MKRTTLLMAILVFTLAGFAVADDQNAPCAQAVNARMHARGPMAPMGPGMRGMRRGMGPGEGLNRLLDMADELKLSDQQREKLRGMFTDFATERIDRQADLQKAEIRLAEMMRDDNANDADVNRGIDEVARLRADMQKMQYAHRKAVLSVLTDKQRDQLKQMRMDRRDRMRDQMDDDEDNTPQPPEQVIPPYRPRRGSL